MFYKDVMDYYFVAVRSLSFGERTTELNVGSRSHSFCITVCETSRMHGTVSNQMMVAKGRKLAQSSVPRQNLGISSLPLSAA